MPAAVSHDIYRGVAACPVDACFAEDQLPDEWQQYIQVNANYYKR